MASGPKISIEVVIAWLAEHGYRDQYPRRDASNPDALLHVFVKDGSTRLAIRSVHGVVKRLHFEKLKQVVLQNEEGEDSEDS
jgi:hypothetical protein